MKKFNLIVVLVAVVILAGLTNCTKEVTNPVNEKTYVDAIAGSFNAQDGDLTFKSVPVAPLGVNRVWSMYKGTFPTGFTLVDGSEFISGSLAYEFWRVPTNNPITFPVSSALYSNLTPALPVRLVTETLDANNKVAYLGILDFNPTTANFPLTVHGYRLGDVLAINTDALTKLPGANLKITVAFELSVIDLVAMKKGPSTSESGWFDLIYSNKIQNIVTAGSGDFMLYDGLEKKVTGNVVITITEDGNPNPPIVLTVPAREKGKGMLIKLTTTKVGWYNSATINIYDTNIDVLTVEVPVI